tara:strand:+ start:3405 stop:3878 length:474 start_codon:yes stop_codon:yes gene_type:complete
MKRLTYKDLVAEISPFIKELLPWDVEELMTKEKELIFLDVRELDEFETMCIQNSINVPRGILETAIDWDHEETEPILAKSRDQKIIIVCRSGNRSVFAAFTLQKLGFTDVASLKTGLRGWNEYNLPLIDQDGVQVDPELGDKYFANKLLPDQINPKK